MAIQYSTRNRMTVITSMATKMTGTRKGAPKPARKPSGWSKQLGFVEEPLLEFAYGQTAEHPRDGLYLYGPVANQPGSVAIDYGVIGTERGLVQFGRWAKQVGLAIPRHVPKLNPEALHHITFPGFEAAFNTKWPFEPAARIKVDSAALNGTILIGNRAEAIKKTVDLFVDPLIAFADQQEVAPKFWFVVIPEVIYRYGRSKQSVPKELRTQGTIKISRAQAAEALKQPSLFPEDDEGADIYEYGLDFRRQLKARLLAPRIVTQLVRETTITPEDFKNSKGFPIRPVEDPATIAWKLCTTAYYKAGGQPWRLANVRPGVCYVGLVFKQTEPTGNEANACCAAQMFLASGDGVVFRGALGPWYTPSKKEFHLTQDAAKQLIGMVIEAYKEEHDGVAPKELFVHGKARFSKEEWDGFKEAAPADTKLVCVQIKLAKNEIKLFRGGRYPVIRGTVLKLGDRSAYLWTSGYVARLDTYMGPETPNPIFVNVHWGECEFDTVLKDVMGLTKINFNTCLFNDGRPVTIRFAEAVGDVLVAAPQGKVSPKLPFKFYI
jgi:hypothetical protein